MASKFTFIKKSFLLLAILIVIDRVLPLIFDQLFYKQWHGDESVTIDILKPSNKADVVIFGSSRASHHYISDSISNYTNLKVFNAGRDAMGIHYTHGIIKTMLQTQQPKIVIIDIIPNNFLFGGQSSEAYLDKNASALLPFANKYPIVLQV
jgi:hypothetical protein